MGNMISVPTSRRAVWRPLWELPSRFDLIGSFVRRGLAVRYRGSVLGIVWAVLTPAVMIAIYTFIFAGIFGARFGAQGSAWEYALYLFCGLLPWTAFQEALQLSSNVIVANANLVKRVVFPLETLPISQALSAVINQLFGTLALIAATLLIRGELHWTLVWLPLLVWLQLVMMLGAAWFIASLGVFVRDTGQVLALVLTGWMYLTPIIYPEAVVPARFRLLINANPWTGLVRSYRRIILEGAPPDWTGLAYFAVCAVVCFVFGYWWFAKTRRNFADVI